MRFTGQVAVVTGASRGIGAAVARRLARDGATVALLYKSNRKAAEEVAADIRRGGGRAAVIQADVSDEQSTKTAMEQVVAALGQVSILANIAGVYEEAPVGSISRQ